MRLCGCSEEQMLHLAEKKLENQLATSAVIHTQVHWHHLFTAPPPPRTHTHTFPTVTRHADAPSRRGKAQHSTAQRSLAVVRFAVVGFAVVGFAL